MWRNKSITFSNARAKWRFRSLSNLIELDNFLVVILLAGLENMNYREMRTALAQKKGLKRKYAYQVVLLGHRGRNQVFNDRGQLRGTQTLRNASTVRDADQKIAYTHSRLLFLARMSLLQQLRFEHLRCQFP